MIKLICLDVDGTLLDKNRNIPAANLSAIKKALDKGVKITIVSGRISQSAREFSHSLGIYGPTSSFGGCLLEDEDLNIIEEYSLKNATSSKVIELSHKHGISLLMYHRHNWYSDPTIDSKWTKSEFAATNVEGCFVDSLFPLLDKFSVNKFLAIQEDHCKLKAFEEELNSACPGEVKTFKSYPHFLEIVPPEADKGRAVQGLCRYYGFDENEVMTIGDYYNDIFMFKHSGISVAVANAPEEVKKNAVYTTKADCNDGAVAEAINRFVL